MTRSLWLVIGLGWALRSVHYLRDPSVWHDEAALIINVLRNDFAQLLGPLRWNEAAPPLFLWLERTVVLLLGESTLALRLIPFAASCLALPLFATTAARHLPARGAFWAVLLVAVSDRLLWHACEAKPYSIDVLFATCVMFGWDRTTDWTLRQRSLALIAVTPLAIFLSYPACFLLGALWLALTPAIAQRPARLWFLTWSVVLGASFLVLYFGPIRAQRTGPMEGCWITQFPDWSRPWSVPGWSVISTLDVLRYNFKPFGFLLVGLLLIGIAVSWRRDRAWSILLTAPLALALIAALIGGYPYGGSRLEVFAVPALALLIGAGVDPLRGWLNSRVRWAYAVAVVPLFLLPACWTAYWVAVPWPRIDAAGASQFIRERMQPGEPVVANHWEYAYYFRDQPDGFFLDVPLPSAPRVWITVTAGDDGEREHIIQEFSNRGRVIERRDFMYTVVLLLERTEPSVAQR